MKKRCRALREAWSERPRTDLKKGYFLVATLQLLLKDKSGSRFQRRNMFQEGGATCAMVLWWKGIMASWKECFVFITITNMEKNLLQDEVACKLF